jgi:hypothetical protein
MPNAVKPKTIDAILTVAFLALLALLGAGLGVAF